VYWGSTVSVSQCARPGGQRQYEVLLGASRLVLGVEPIEAVRELRRKAEQAIKRE
jgi:hypothetical protein